MAGTTIGGQRAAETNKKRYGKNFYAVIGQMGGKLGRDGGFAYTEQRENGTIVEVGKMRAIYYGKIGGMKSRRGPAR